MSSATRGCEVTDCPEIRLLRDSYARGRQHQEPCLRIGTRRACAGVAEQHRQRRRCLGAVRDDTGGNHRGGSADGVGRVCHHHGRQVRLSVGELDPADQHHERRARRLASETPKPAAPKHPAATPRRSSQREAAGPATAHAPPQPAGALPPPPPPPTQITPPEAAPVREATGSARHSAERQQRGHSAPAVLIPRLCSRPS